MRAGDRVTATCHDLDDEGAGLCEPAAAGGVRLHVAGALPGERVTATVTHVSTQAPAAWARLDAVDVASGTRRPPACPAAGACGGCVIQHWAYEAQLGWKRARVEGALAAYREDLGAVPVDACVASPRPLGYRNKAKLVPARARDARGGPAGPLVLGAFAPRSHDVVDLAGCRVVEPALERATEAVRAFLDEAAIAPYDERTLAGDLRYVILRANRDGQVLAVWIARRSLPGGEPLARAFRAAHPEIAGVVEHVNRSRGNALFDDRSGETRVLDGAATLEDRLQVDSQSVRVRLSAGAFFQSNRDVAGLAYAAIVRAAAVRAGERVVDAYCGVGGIALALARGAGEVVGVESHAGAVDDATASAALNGVGHARFVAGDAAATLAGLDRADVLVLNPPRKGCAPELLAAAARLRPRIIPYLSCDPDTLARDLAVLAQHGYRARTVTPFDMLPHTPHVETLALIAPA